jgi:hypothetical protein
MRAAVPAAFGDIMVYEGLVEDGLGSIPTCRGGLKLSLKFWVKGQQSCDGHAIYCHGARCLSDIESSIMVMEAHCRIKRTKCKNSTALKLDDVVRQPNMGCHRAHNGNAQARKQSST